MVKKLVVSSPTKNYCFFSNENSIVGDLNPKLHSDIALPQSVLRLNRLLFAVVVMLMTRVIDAGIVVVLVADRRDSFTGATIMKFRLFSHLILQLLFILQFFSKFYYIHEYFPKLLIMQSRPSECSDFTILVRAVLFYIVCPRCF